MPSTYRDDPYPAMHFLVIINGISDDGHAVRASFSEVAGLGVEIEPIEYRTGSEDITVRKLPGLKKYTNLVLKRGVTGDAALWDWLKAAMDGQVIRTAMSIILLDEARQPVVRWNVRRAWPCKWSGPALHASKSEVAIETLEVCHEGIELDR